MTLVEAFKLLELPLANLKLQKADLWKKARQCYRTVARKHHPDVGGQEKDFIAARAAFDKVEEYCRTPNKPSPKKNWRAENHGYSPSYSRTRQQLFLVFRDFLLMHQTHNLNEAALHAMGTTDEERLWLKEWLMMAYEIGFIISGRVSPYMAQDITWFRFMMVYNHRIRPDDIGQLRAMELLYKSGMR